MHKGRSNPVAYDAPWNLCDNSSDEDEPQNEQNARSRTASDSVFSWSGSSSRNPEHKPGFRRHSGRPQHTSENQNYRKQDTERIKSHYNRRSQLTDRETEKQPIKSAEQEPKASFYTKRKFPMSFLVMSNLIKKDPNEILLTILNEGSGFYLVLEKEDTSRDMMAYVLLAIGKAITSYMRKNVNAMLNLVTSSNLSFFKKVNTFLKSFYRGRSDDYHLNSLVSLSEFLMKFQDAMPSNASDPLIDVLPLLEKTCKTYLIDKNDLYVRVLKNVQEIEVRNMHFLQGYTEKKVERSSRKERLQLQLPPEDYRSIPILPTVEDIRSSCSFLRPNLVKGQYQDTEHYLDVQYRLLREDYVRPLRDGIAEYLSLKKQKKSVKQCKDVRIYSDVHIIKQQFVNGGLVHFAHFTDKNFARIKWEYSKRFLTGSLLCLSSDDFETMLFALVARREPKELSKGLLLLRFETLTDEVLNMNPLRNFVVVETTSYFEAYRYNLQALQQLNESTLPMKSYIVDVQKNVQKPQYLQESVTYDMRPLLLPLDSKYINYKEDEDEKICNTYDFPKDLSPTAKSVRILKDDHWPSYSDLNLDPTQYAAIKAAVTKEFAVIQGPPGTGKTYVGLRVAQLLLHNMDKWQSETNSSRILVVCYTNHALDQFLEGLLLFTQKIVRIGGRGTNEAITKYQLTNLKRIIEDRREVPNHLFRSIRQKRFELHQLSKLVVSAQTTVEKCYSTLLGEDLLKDSMPAGHYDSLKSGCNLEDDEFIIHDWLGIRVRVKGLVPTENDWEFQGNERDREQHILNNLSNIKAFTAGEVEQLEDIWLLPFIDRCRLYKFWLECYIIKERKCFIENCYSNVLSENVLESSLPRNHYDSLKDMSVINDGFVIHNWLGIRINSGISLQKVKVKEQIVRKTLKYFKAFTKTEVENIKNIWQLLFTDRCRLYKFWLENYITTEQTKFIKNCYSNVLSENVLKTGIFEVHYDSLKSKCVYHDDGSIVQDWLGVRIKSGETLQNQVFNMSAKKVSKSVSEVADTDSFRKKDDDLDLDGEGEADVEYIEAQREINSEEFEGVSYDESLNENIEMISEVESGGWKVQGGEKRRKKFITKSLKYIPAMTETEATGIENIWFLPIDHRWRLYRYWLECHIAKKQREVFEIQQTLRKEFEELNEIQTQVDLYVCLQAHVVGMTTTGAAKYRNIVQHLNPKIVIVEEAAEILESHIVTSLTTSTQHVILIGDHQQLKPSPAVYTLAVQYDLNVSLFERMVQNGMECYRLGIQHRMRPEIAALLVPHIYKDLKNHESVLKYENIKGVSKNVFFITHNFSELQEYDSKSKVNEHEARFLIKLCTYILLQGYEPSQITVLTTYLGQLFALKKLIGDGLLKGVKFTVVDNYQGEENDVILISFVRSNEEGEIGFLKVSNRVCVALSRAKKGLFCIGNFELLMEKSSLWKNIVNILQRNQAIGSSLQLSCQNHPTVNNVVANDKDFDAVREGGCTRNCEFRLQCGHVCSLICHPYDMEHLTIECYKPCTKICSDGHSCKRKCFQDCGPCTEMIDKKLKSCGHIIKVKCSLKNEEQACTKPCDRLLSCGHKCKTTCNTACTIKCEEIIEIVSFMCGHKVSVECCFSSDLEILSKKCKKVCGAELACEHMCKGTCSQCCQGRLHVRCKQSCKRILVCGHECKSLCSNSCPPCKRPCENRCVHSTCPKTCGEPCRKCTEPCEWSCQHKKCTRPCGEICNRSVCDKPCPKLLKCEHPCIGLCGEVCPEECRVCDKEKVQDILFGNEDKDDAKFIYLEDCKHIIEFSSLQTWFKRTMQGKNEIQMPVCPKCKTVIRRNLSFGNIVKSCLADIEKVKIITFGDTERNLSNQKSLLLRAKSKTTDVLLMCKPIIKTLLAPHSRSKVELTVMENIINLTETLESGTNVLGYLSHRIVTLNDTIVQHFYNKLVQYIKASKQLLVNFMQDEYLTASEHQLQDLSWEIHRLNVGSKLLQFIYNHTNVKWNTELKNLMDCLISYGPFRDLDAEKFAVDFNKLYSQYGDAIINISDLKKLNILMVMGLSKDHWYLCPNGHVYSDTNFGDATGERRCYECGVKVGSSIDRMTTAFDRASYFEFSDEEDTYT